jgi:hypothetical protein
MYLGVFLFWNDYPDKENKFFTITGLKFTGLAIFVFLIFKFRSGQFENNGSLVTSWWGLLGLIGWGYLVSAFTYVLCRDSILKISLFTFLFLVMNMLSNWKLLSFLDPLKPVFGIIIDGNVPFIVLSGLIGGLIIKKIPVLDFKKVIPIFIGLGVLYIISGFILRKWFIISKIQATPSWAMICIGISFLVFTLLYWIIDGRNKISWVSFLQPAGQNSLTTYIAPYILYCLILSTGIPLLIYKQSHEPMIVVAGSIIWALLMVGLTALLVRLKIKLKV